MCNLEAVAILHQAPLLIGVVLPKARLRPHTPRKLERLLLLAVRDLPAERNRSCPISTPEVVA